MALSRGARAERSTHVEHVTVDPVRCEGHGICALHLPDRLDLDRWGFPIVDGRPLETARERRRARRAARACPRRALLVESRSP